MSTFPHPRSGPQDPPFLRQATHPNQERDLNKLDHTLSATSYQRSPNFTSPIYSGGGGYQQSSPAFIHPPPQIDMPPYRAQYDARFQMNQPLVPIRPYYPNPRDMNIPFPNYAQSNTPNPSVESLQPPELPPKPRSGQQQQLQPPVQQVQAMNQQPVVNEPVMLPRDTHEQEPNLFQPPPVPARPGQQQTLDPRKSPVPEKKPTSGRINASDPNIAAQLEEMSNDPGIVTERLKKVAEVLSAWPKKYEAAIQGKARKLHESVMHANQDLGFLKDELQKARMSLQSSQTDNHDLKGELQVLREENQAMRQGGNAPTESFFSNEETQLLIADLRNEIVALKSEVPDPNLCDSLRLMIQLLEEDKRTVQNKYTQVNEELHSRDNEISRLMRDHEASGNFIQEGRIGLEKQFNSQLAELRRQNNTLSQQLDYSNQKLEMSQRRDATENEPGPSRVELMGVVETANKFNDQLQLKVHEKEDEITRLKKLLESSREILTSSSTSNQTYSQSESETRTKDEIVFLRIQIKNLEREVEELRQNQFVKPKSDGRLENDLAEARERVKKCEGVIHDREMQIRMLQNNVRERVQEKEKEDLIGTLLQEKDTLTQQLDDLKVEIDSQKPMKEKVLVLTNWLEGRDKLIQRLNDTISHLKNEAGIYQRNTEEYDRRSQEQAEYGNRWRQEASKSEQTMLWYKSKVQELEVRLAKAPSMDTAKEVYDVMVESMTRDMNALRVEKEKVESVYKAQCDHVQKLQQSLKDLSVECAELKNQRQVYGPHQCFDIGSGAPRYPDPQTPSSGAQRELVQGRDTGVKYPPH